MDWHKLDSLQVRWSARLADQSGPITCCANVDTLLEGVQGPGSLSARV